MDKFIEYAPIIMVVIGFAVSYGIFVTPAKLSEALQAYKTDDENNKKYVTAEDMQLEHKKLLEEVEQRFLSIVAFREFERRIEDNFNTINRRFSESSHRFDKVDGKLDHIEDLLVRR